MEAVAQLRPIGESWARPGGCGVLAEAGPNHDGGMPGQESVGNRVQVRTQLFVNLGCCWSGHSLEIPWSQRCEPEVNDTPR